MSQQNYIYFSQSFTNINNFDTLQETIKGFSHSFETNNNIAKLIKYYDNYKKVRDRIWDNINAPNNFLQFFPFYLPKKSIHNSTLFVHC